MQWSDVNPKWPNQKITLYGAGADSGTFDYFTEAVVGKAKASRGDYTASEDDNVLVQGIENDANSLGYIPFAYYAPYAAKMKALAVDWGKGQGCMKPSLEAVLAGTYNPLSRPLFIYVSKKAADTKPEVREFVEFTMKNAVPLVTEVKYLPLPDRAYEGGIKKFRDGKTGSVFGGVPEVGVSIDDVIGREAKS
jgi:phosphate transport system substrate-binding protein